MDPRSWTLNSRNLRYNLKYFQFSHSNRAACCNKWMKKCEIVWSKLPSYIHQDRANKFMSQYFVNFWYFLAKLIIIEWSIVDRLLYKPVMSGGRWGCVFAQSLSKSISDFSRRGFFAYSSLADIGRVDISLILIDSAEQNKKQKVRLNA